MATTRKKIGPDRYEVRAEDGSKLGEVYKDAGEWVGTTVSGSWVSTDKVFRVVASSLEAADVHDLMAAKASALRSEYEAEKDEPVIVKAGEAGPFPAHEEPRQDPDHAPASFETHLETLESALARAIAGQQEQPAAVKTIGEMEPAERDAVVAKAVEQLQEELTAAAPAIAVLLEEEDPVASTMRVANTGEERLTFADMEVAPETPLARAASRTVIPEGSYVEYAIQRGSRVDGGLETYWITIRSSRSTSLEYVEREAERLAVKFRVRIVSREVTVTEWEKVDF
jgi:hypothetical protein